ncbi:hypothetical protein [Microbacterium rhizomatis]|uniref:CBM-cenC domain-containing protein n=1 Tax=Microbacterium rhizomatis TaxID=1631477 RepID=A0A5J5IWE4_9MICO|nr:hypothetical protein [Microbacterium rhizomatis]KAA9105003.1 hypothetical protein F6B43_18315 [Microbacterium rhizomatis]
MRSAHTYTAALIGSPDIALRVKGGSIKLDEATAPHVQGTLTIAIPALSTLTALDPRLGKRVRVSVAAAFPTGTQSRTFDLTLRERSVSHRDGTVALAVASDEALLGDYAPLADDTNTLALAGSLRSVINYVLTTAGIGATLASTPAGDADLTPYWSITNLVTNPQADTATGYLAAGGTSAVATSGSSPWQGSASVVWNASAAGASFLQVPNEPACRAEETFTASAYVRANTGTTTRTCSILVRFTNDAGALMGDFTSIPIGISYSTWTRLGITVTAPPGATKVYMFIRQNAVAAADQFAVDAPMLYRDSRMVPFFHGSSTGGGYNYQWGSGGANASTSTRVPILERSPESFTWRAGQSALEFLVPLFQAAGYRLVCDETRTWTLRGAGYTAPGNLTVRHAVNLIDATDTLTRDGLWFDGQVTRHRWTEAGEQREAVDAWALTATPTRVNRVELNTPYPGPGRSQYAVQRAQGRGRDVTVETVADWTAAAEQPITGLLDGAPAQVGKTSSITYNLDNDRMTIVTRTTDTPLGAIDLLSSTINSLTGTINSL